MDTVDALRKYNRWRRGLDAWHEAAGPNPTDIGEQIDAAADEIERLRTLLAEAADEIESWGAYAGSHFQQKHDLAGTVARFRKAAAISANDQAHRGGAA